MTAIFVIYSIGASKDQNNAFTEDEDTFQNAIYLMRQANFAEALPVLQDVLRNQPDSYLATLNYGHSLIKLGRFEDAKIYLDKAREQRPFVVTNPTYLLDYGNVLYAEGKYKEAKKYFLFFQENNKNPAITDKVNQMLTDLDEKLKGTGDTNGKK